VLDRWLSPGARRPVGISGEVHDQSQPPPAILATAGVITSDMRSDAGARGSLANTHSFHLLNPRLRSRIPKFAAGINSDLTRTSDINASQEPAQAGDQHEPASPCVAVGPHRGQCPGVEEARAPTQERQDTGHPGVNTPENGTTVVGQSTGEPRDAAAHQGSAGLIHQV
jgi:hypothetical protein